MIKSLPRIIIALSLLGLVTGSCSKEYDCDEPQLHPAFIGFTLAEIDTLILEKYKAGDNFQTRIDTHTVVLADHFNSLYTVYNDTTSVFVKDHLKYIKAGFDWRIYIPAINRTITITAIEGEKRTGKRNSGIFSMDPSPNCLNDVHTAIVDNQPFIFSSSAVAEFYRNYNIYIHH